MTRFAYTLTVLIGLATPSTGWGQEPVAPAPEESERQGGELKPNRDEVRSAEAREQLATIIEQVTASIDRPEGMPPEVWTQYRARIFVRIDGDGRISAANMLKSSGNSECDGAVFEGLRGFDEGSLRLDLQSVSDSQLRDLLIERGLIIIVVPR